jgi:hypothetical protein
MKQVADTSSCQFILAMKALGVFCERCTEFVKYNLLEINALLIGVLSRSLPISRVTSGRVGDKGELRDTACR